MIEAIIIKEQSSLSYNDDWVDYIYSTPAGYILSAISKSVSTGLGQITGSTAAYAIAKAVEMGLCSYSDLGISKEEVENKDYKAIFKKLQDNEINVKVMAVILMIKSNDLGFGVDLNQLTSDQMEKVFSSYNGSGEAAQEYGKDAKKYYDQLEK